MLKTVSSITNAIGALNYKGTWNASTNTPAITSSVGVKGDYYVVSVGGATNIDGLSNWGVGDWITYNGSVWQRVEGGADLNGVNIDYTGTLTGGTGIVNIGSGQLYKATNGNFGVGTTTPQTKFEVSSVVGTTMRLNSTADKNTWTIGEVLTEIQSYGLDSTSSQQGVRTFIRTVNEVDTFGQYWGLSFGTSTFNGSATQKMLLASNGAVHFPSVGTTASAANAFLDNSATPANQLLRSTSSIRYKTDVETVESPFADKVLELRPVWYRSLAEADKKEWSWYGLIAEEVAEVEPRLVHWSYPELDYEEVTIESEVEGEEPKTERKLKEDAKLVPDGVQYERLSVLLLDVVKRQQQEIDSLRTRLDAANL